MPFLAMLTRFVFFLLLGDPVGCRSVDLQYPYRDGETFAPQMQFAICLAFFGPATIACSFRVVISHVHNRQSPPYEFGVLPKGIRERSACAMPHGSKSCINTNKLH